MRERLLRRRGLRVQAAGKHGWLCWGVGVLGLRLKGGEEMVKGLAAVGACQGVACNERRRTACSARRASALGPGAAKGPAV